MGRTKWKITICIVRSKLDFGTFPIFGSTKNSCDTISNNLDHCDRSEVTQQKTYTRRGKVHWNGGRGGDRTFIPMYGGHHSGRVGTVQGIEMCIIGYNEGWGATSRVSTVAIYITAKCEAF